MHTAPVCQAGGKPSTETETETDGDGDGDRDGDGDEDAGRETQNTQKTEINNTKK